MTNTTEAVARASKWLRACSAWMLSNDLDMKFGGVLKGAMDEDPLDIADDLDALAATQLPESDVKAGAGERLRKCTRRLVEGIDALEKEYGFDRPMHQLQPIMLPLCDLIAIRAQLADPRFEQFAESANCTREPTPPAEPVGDWVMVPREPTEAMLDAGFVAWICTEHVGPEGYDSIWSAMLAAAPQLASTVEGEDNA